MDKLYMRRVLRRLGLNLFFLSMLKFGTTPAFKFGTTPTFNFGKPG